jgi:hypothetical protein
MNLRTFPLAAACAAFLAGLPAAHATQTIALGALIQGDPGTNPQYLCGGKVPAIVQVGGTWSYNGAWNYVNTGSLNGVTSRGAMPEITWQSIDGKTGAYYSVHDIAAGTNPAYESYITAFATGLKNYGAPVLLRFDHEMNGWWEPWSTGAGGPGKTAPNTTADYIAAWRHLHDRFVAVGATNVRWVFCVSNEVGNNYGSTIASNFPGASYVDWLAFDAYNFGTGWSNHQEGWVPLTYGVGTAYSSLDALGTNKPMMINEIGCAENGGSKASWITTSLMQTIPTLYPKVQVVSWFHRDSMPDEPDWRIDSSSTAKAAFAAAAQSPLYAGKISADGKHVAEIRYETESAIVYGQSSDTHRIINDTNFSGGAGTILDANAVNDYVTYTLPLLPAGSYNVYVGIKKINTRGQFQLAVSRSDVISFSNLGSVIDEYDPSTSGIFTEVNVGAWSPTTTSDKLFRFTVAGKNAGSSSYAICFDYVRFVPQ